MSDPDSRPELESEPGPRDDGLRVDALDFINQEQGDEFDNLVPARRYQLSPVVGIGGSAGSLAALQEFFAKMPADTGMTFVVITHLAPEFESSLPQLLARCTTMEVLPAENGHKMRVNTVYVIPPGKFLTVVDGHLRLTPIEPERGRRVAVDLFFRSLADIHGPHAAAIVLSGADGDGAIGIKRIKERGGLTIAQDPDEAEHHGMPQSAIATGMVDWVLPVGEMPRRLIDYRRSEQRLQVPSEEGPLPRVTRDAMEEGETALREVLAYLRARTGHDFASYKRATIVRRISRRMQINGVADLPAYLVLLRTYPGEAGALLQDLLISVTNFFRDRDAFEALGLSIPSLFRDKGLGEFVRVWVPACATGEEAYSIAILLLEHARTLDAAPGLQVFGCDLDESAIQIARAGRYPDAIAADVSDERLHRYFLKEAGGYRVRREVREIVLFAAHDLLKDAPFSRLDLISCRNLLIYLNREAQRRALDIFHFALRPHGLLFLGSSEMVEEGSSLFHVVDKKFRIFVQQPSQRVGLPMPSGPSTIIRALEEQARRGPCLPNRSFTPAALPEPFASRKLDHLSLDELHYRLLERLAPPSVIVNAEHEIVHLSENAGQFLQLAGGDATLSLLRVVHPMLRIELRAALFRAAESGAEVEVPRAALELDGVTRAVGIRVEPARDLAPGFLLVIFEIRDAAVDEAEVSVKAQQEPVLRQLERELEVMTGRLQETVEQYEANTEELKASNEELQAMNEELRSASEELETSREELQSINEELTTVNQELKSKLEELGHANSDLHNLMASTAIATVFLDRDLRIMRYTPSAATLFRIIPSDLGRSLADLRHRVDYAELPADAHQVLDTLVPMEREVRDADGHWFLARLLPYRTLDDHIAGVVLALVDITERRRAEGKVRESEAALRMATDASRAGWGGWDLQTGAASWDTRGKEIIGFSSDHEAASIEGWYRHIHPEDVERVRQEIGAASRDNRDFNIQYRVIRADGQARIIHAMGRFTLPEDATARRGTGLMMDITDRRRAEDTLRESQERFRLIVENAREFAIFSTDLARNITSWNTGAERLLGYSESEILGASADIIFTSEDRARDEPVNELARVREEGRAVNERWHVRKDGSRFWGSGMTMSMRNPADEAIGFVKIMRDQTEAVQARDAIEKSRLELMSALAETERAKEDAESANRTKDQFLAVLSHELRTPLTPVLMGVRTLARQSGLSPETEDILAMIQRNVKLEAHLIDDLLDLTRIARGKLEFVFEPVDMNVTIRHAVEISAESIQAKQQSVDFRLEAAEATVEGDAMRLQQVIWNLIKNASKFSPECSRIEVSSRNEPGEDGAPGVVIDVRDYGIGFESGARDRIFKAFTQASDEVGKRFGGLGLGLAISRATVEAHDGYLGAASPGPDQGATFTVRLPLVRKRRSS